MLSKDGRLSTPEVSGQEEKVSDVERVTRHFYTDFKREHGNFSKSVKGLDEQDEVSCYTSVMLDRLMFVYFIQKKGFLDGDIDYLANKLKQSKAEGTDRFYHEFLIQLFFNGFAREERDRPPIVKQLLGRIPYLNGGLFVPHQLERAHGEDIRVSDDAFEAIFAFFDQYSWQLDYRPLRPDKAINPDVLGYIFERYINQKQMGAYYTKEDITDYICKSTIIPVLFDRLEDMRYDELHPFPMKDVEPYVYDAVKQRQPLPTETDREYEARQTRYQRIEGDFAAGRIASINDLLTYNLNIGRFAQDWVAGIRDPVTLRAFYFHCLTKVTILDPTVGSGAFLLAAANLLEPLYEICLYKMEELTGAKYPDFANELERISQHPSRQYFILKSIIVNNLFGVDIMEEAVEICKLRLFLKLVAQVEDVSKIEALPDIDFNILTGNTLVGYTSQEEVKAVVKGGGAQGKMDFGGEIDRINQGALAVARAFQSFRASQSQIGIDSRELTKAKDRLTQDLGKLQDELSCYLAEEYGIDTTERAAYKRWLATHRPFHWFVGFCGIMRDGGFDVIIGNPPYVSAAKVKRQYTVRNLLSLRCPDVYAWILERNQALLRNRGRTGMIVPLSLGFSSDFAPIRALLLKGYNQNWFSSFGRIPSALFSFDVRVRNTIHLALKDEAPHSNYTTRLHRWFESARPHLFTTLEYSSFNPDLWKGRVPKTNTNALTSAFERCLLGKTNFEAATYPRRTNHILYFKETAYNWLAFCRKLPPCYEDGRPVEHTKFGQVYFRDAETHKLAMLLGNGKLMFIFWCIVGDDFDVTRWNFGEFPIDFDGLDEKTRSELLDIFPSLEQAMGKAVQFKLNAGRRVGNYNLAKCRSVTDSSDRIFAQALPLVEAWEDVELYYSQVVKTDFSNGGEDEK
jgi:hypothetical protein